MKKSLFLFTLPVFLSALPVTSCALHHARSEKQETERAVRATRQAYTPFPKIRDALLVGAHARGSHILTLNPRTYRWIHAGFLRAERSLLIPNAPHAPQNCVLAGHDFPPEFNLAEELARVVDMLDGLSSAEKLLFEEGYNAARGDFLEGFLRYLAGERGDLPT